MTERPTRVDHGLAVRLAARLAVLVLAGVMLVHLKSVLLPIVLAILLSFLLAPLVGGLSRRGVPIPLGILVAEVAATLPLLGVALVFSATAGPLTQEASTYEDRLKLQGAVAVDRALDRFVSESQREVVKQELIEKALPGVVAEGVGYLNQAGVGLATGIGHFFLTLLLSAFMLLEGRRFHEKFGQAFGVDHPILASLAAIGRDVRLYVVAKTLLSGLTALAVWLFLEICDVDFAVFWGLLAFPLNFIPTVGAAVASLPPMLVALVDPEMSGLGFTGVVVGLFAINGLIGSVLDPRYVGQAVKLSPLVVFLSMLIWAALWGPIGMILAVPIMVSVKLVCARVPALEPLATLMQG